MKKKVAILLFFVLLGSSINAQVTKDILWNRADFIEDTDDFLSLKLNANNDIDRIVIDGDRVYSLSPNADVRNNLSVNYKWLTVGFTFVIPNLYDNDRDNKGKTESTDFRLAFNPNKWSVSYHYKMNRGYYLENSEDYMPPPGQEYFVFPNLETHFHRLYIGHIINSKFSLKSLVTFTERQLQNSGSFIPFLRLTYFSLDINNGLMGKEKAHNYETILGTSYTHKFIFRKYFYAAVVGSLGFGYLNSDIDDLALSRNSRTSFNSSMLATQIGGSLGYNGERFFAGTNINRFTNISQKSDDSYTLDTKRQVWEIFIGYRIRTPKFLRKPLKWADEQKEKVIK